MNDLKKLDDTFRDCIKEFNRNDFGGFMHYMKFMFDRFTTDPESVYSFYKIPAELIMKTQVDIPQLKETPNSSFTKETQTSSLSNVSMGTNEDIEIKIEPHEENITKPSTSVKMEESNSIKPTLRPSKNVRYSDITTRELKIKISPKRPTIPLLNTVDMCRVCEVNKKSSYLYGPGVCQPCKLFYSRNFNVKDKFECSENNDCFEKNNIIMCRKCRMDKCISIGMKSPDSVPVPKASATNSRSSSSRKSLNSADSSSCPICFSIHSQLGMHYGAKMCATCAKWFSGVRKNASDIMKSKCIQKEKSKLNQCVGLDDFRIQNCRKCRYKKIVDLINNSC
ncbi:unnamed protein product [Brachionus calyciflorus]|uniref:Nuclear receptor domain-containing protein n=1 Tax=Brachionus calyciflorus TaxID=104777 RepID=A0A813MAU8_9BILA|nr:unnamed protein product [Brachionus calyciflorus]